MPDVSQVLGGRFVGGLELIHRPRRNALHFLTGNNAATLQRFSWVCDAVDVSTAGIEMENVDVDLAADAIEHDEVPVSRGVG